jgi:1-acyl-sn-glycerol-3-phosphate acyltransferase
MRKVLGRIWLIWAAIIFVGFFLITYPLLLIWLSHPRLYRIAHWQRRIWGMFISVFALLIPWVTYEEKIPKGRRIIYCANHASYLDILTCGSYLPGFNFFMAKQELSKVPLFGLWFRTIDIPVERGSITKSYRAFESASKQFDNGIDMVIFPEGRIPANRPKLAPLKAGAFKLAIEKGALVVPVTLPDNHARFPDGPWIATPGIMRCHVHRAIDTVGLKPEDEPELRNQVFTIIANQLEKYGVSQS